MVRANSNVQRCIIALALFAAVSCTPKSPSLNDLDSGVSDNSPVAHPAASGKATAPFNVTFTLPDEQELKVDEYFSLAAILTSQSDHSAMNLRFEVSGPLENEGEWNFETHPLHAGGPEQMNLVLRVTGTGASALQASLYPVSEDPDASHVLSKSLYFYGEGNRIWFGETSQNVLELRALDELLDKGAISTEEHASRIRKIRSGGATEDVHISPPAGQK